MPLKFNEHYHNLSKEASVCSKTHASLGMKLSFQGIDMLRIPKSEGSIYSTSMSLYHSNPRNINLPNRNFDNPFRISPIIWSAHRNRAQVAVELSNPRKAVDRETPKRRLFRQRTRTNTCTRIETVRRDTFVYGWREAWEERAKEHGTIRGAT